MPVSAATFHFKFVGQAVEDGSINVRDFAASALAVGELIEQSNRDLNSDRATASVRLRSDFKGRSFESVVELSVSFYTQAKTLFSGGEIKDAQELLEALGFWGKLTLGGGLLGLLKKLRGRRPTAGRTLERGRVSFTLPTGETLEADRSVADLYNDVRVLQAAREIVRPLEEQPGIERVEFGHSDDPKERNEILRADIPSVVAPSDSLEEGELIHRGRHERIFSVVSPSFSGDYIWRLTDGVNRISATMEDKVFSTKLERGDIAFSGGSLIKAEIETETARTPTGRLSTKTRILRVLQVMPPPRQTLLAFDAQDETSSDNDQA